MHVMYCFFGMFFILKKETFIYPKNWKRTYSSIPLFPKVRFFSVFTFIKIIINVFNIFFNTISNNYPPIKFNQFKYSPLMYLKSIQKYLRNIENLFLWNKNKF